MSGEHVRRQPLDALPLWERLRQRDRPISFELELTARCNSDCRHCYINRPAGDADARRRELTAVEVDRIAGEAASLGAVWCLLTGGEPLLREDFREIYLALRRRGLLVGLFTNAVPVTPDLVSFLKAHPPQSIEVTVYGVTARTYERVSRVAGSFAAFRRGLDLLLGSGLRVTLKAMAMRSTRDELPAIAAFCKPRSAFPFRFDPLLHLRYDGDAERNRIIREERLSGEDIAALERADPERFSSLVKHCGLYINPELAAAGATALFGCSPGAGRFTVGPEGVFRPCASLHHPDFLYDLRRGSLADALKTVLPRIRGAKSARPEFLAACRSCPVINLCLWCPAHAYLECGSLDQIVPEFCRVARARAAGLVRGLAGRGGPE